MTIVSRIFLVLGLFVISSSSASGWTLPAPDKYGQVIIDNFSRNAGTPPVKFDHWLHRAIYTCRLCHVDIGFAMEKNETKITAEANSKGFYCGACHNGIRTFKDHKIFASCLTKLGTAEEVKRCDRCHIGTKTESQQNDYATFTVKLPKEKFGNLIDWEKAESESLIVPIDYLEGISNKRKPLKAQEDFSITSQSTWMSDIIFSHKKHALWNGCEVCHPDIFPNIKKNTHSYSMFDISEGKYCGVCHDHVAFPLNFCDRCHSKPVGP